MAAAAGGEYVNGTIELGGEQQCQVGTVEGYTHGIAVIENVRQLRGDVDDSCPVGPDDAGNTIRLP